MKLELLVQNPLLPLIALNTFRFAILSGLQSFMIMDLACFKWHYDKPDILRSSMAETMTSVLSMFDSPLHGWMCDTDRHALSLQIGWGVAL
jgi:hypothetical protein